MGQHRPPLTGAGRAEAGSEGVDAEAEAFDGSRCAWREERGNQLASSWVCWFLPWLTGCLVSLRCSGLLQRLTKPAKNHTRQRWSYNCQPCRRHRLIFPLETLRTVAVSPCGTSGQRQQVSAPNPSQTHAITAAQPVPTKSQSRAQGYFGSFYILGWKEIPRGSV